VLLAGEGLGAHEVLEVLSLPDDRLDEALALAHEVRMRWCGPEVEVEGIVSVKTGGCPEDCHFCSQSGQFTSPVRAVWLDIPGLVAAARETRATGATEFCIVAAVRGPDARLLGQVRDAIEAIRADGNDVQIACSLGMLTSDQVDELVRMGVHRYNHNLETARSYFPSVVTTHTWEERWSTLELVRAAGMEVCCGGIVGMGEGLDDRVGMIVALANLPAHPQSVPINMLVKVEGTPLASETASRAVLDPIDFVRTIAVARITMPKSMVRLSAGREHMSDETQALCFLGGANSIFCGPKLLTTPNPGPDRDMRLMDRLGLAPME
jgi:biotin synthase